MSKNPKCSDTAVYQLVLNQNTGQMHQTWIQLIGFFFTKVDKYLILQKEIKTPRGSIRVENWVRQMQQLINVYKEHIYHISYIL